MRRLIPGGLTLKVDPPLPVLRGLLKSKNPPKHVDGAGSMSGANLAVLEKSLKQLCEEARTTIARRNSKQGGATWTCIHSGFPRRNKTAEDGAERRSRGSKKVGCPFHISAVTVKTQARTVADGDSGKSPLELHGMPLVVTLIFILRFLRIHFAFNTLNRHGRGGICRRQAQQRLS